MNIGLRNKIGDLIIEAGQKIKAGNSNITEDEAMDIFRVIMHVPLSKEEACQYLNLRRSRFDDLVKANQFPKGRKRRGFNELVWYEDELEACKRK